ncbi:mitotic checkpoint regulator, MAD2B-interacting-domain-containing protein [Mucor mucedo]|uniref:mitotic checkpoint regulator, MAD2B-interacting-domain-containing protein n=1 Tax=Mucor mucedo TaxID=29922 RepID=UPI00221F088A|nr:mitotic checkpoint regulator, MAD2B-interacting-domain-containing protein [Mucor mucedo]KAI7871377.1 mitotic checkpoint regulator, MAD2B-interacting-domain-containing protein [Mucor mucedo]
MLVPDYSSSSSDSESEVVVHTPPPKRSLSGLLPAPKKAKTIHIALPKLDDDDTTEGTSNPPQKSSSGLGLADLLPAPKHGSQKSTFSPALPKKSKGKEKRVSPEPTEQPVEQEEEEEEEEEEEVVDYAPKKSFFHFGKDLKEERTTPTAKPVQATPGPLYSVERAPAVEEPQFAAVDAYAYDPNAMYSADPSTYYQYQQQQQLEESDHVGDLEDGQDLQRMVGKRLRGESNIQIKTIHQRDMLPTKEWREQQALTAAPKFNNGMTMSASKLQMKKNNIMALAAHAVNNQEKLDEMFAAHKKTRREASTKYGF